ncbi:MAG: hypothetical protein ABSD99_04230 [Candidatus Bathyarchaeia archaeon]
MTDVGVSELANFCQSLERDVMKEHEKRFSERTRAVKEACSALENAASRLEAAVRNAWGTMDKSASEYGTRMAGTIQETARNLPRQQTSSNYQDVEKFHEESVEALNRIIKTVRKYLPKLRRGLRVEMATLNAALGRLESAVRSLGAALDESPGNGFELLKKDAELLPRMHSELLKLRAEASEQAKSLEALEGREKEILTAKENVASEEAFLELEGYENSLRAKGDDIKQFFQPVVKPLTKLERAASANRNKTVDIGTLQGLIDNPIDTVAAGQTFALARLLDQLGNELATGDLDIEERRLRRAEETIQQFKAGVVDKMREEYLAIQANVQETRRQLKASGLMGRMEELDQTLASIRREKESLTAHNSELHRRIDTLTKNVLKHKTSIEHQIAEITDKSVTIEIT